MPKRRCDSGQRSQATVFAAKRWTAELRPDKLPGCSFMPAQGEDIVMQINVETKPVASAAYNTKKKRLIETIDRLYHRDAKASLQKVISRLHPADLASILDELPPEHMVDIFYAISETEMAAEVFSQLSVSLRT
ncbi:MAG TPA: hypothetical protein PKL62_09120, partial [Accumulibacter sp.]|nr:hypothetical protein [Accumulibacter sp.]